MRGWCAGLVALTSLVGPGQVTPELLLERYASGLRSVDAGWLYGGPQWMPDGSALVFVAAQVNASDPSGGRDRRWIERAESGTGERRRLAEGVAPMPSPDGGSVAFVGTDRQLRTVPALGGPVRRLTSEAGGLRGGPDAGFAVAWSPDSKRLAYAVSGKLRVVDLAAAKITTVRESKTAIAGVDWLPDARSLVYATQDGSRYTVERMRLRSRKRSVLAQGKGYSFLALPRVSPDGRWVAFREPSLPIATALQWTYLSVVSTGGGRVRRLSDDRTMLMANGGAHHWGADGRLYAGVRVGAFVRTAVFGLDGGLSMAGTDPLRGTYDPVPARDGSLAYLSADAAGSVELRVTAADRRSERLLVDLTPEVAKLERGAVQEVSWRAPDGLRLSGLLVEPLGYQQGRRYPMLVDVHGGPVGGFFNAGNVLGGSPLEWHLWAAKGYAVFVPNYRSDLVSGKRAYDASVRGRDYMRRDAADVESGVDEVVRLGVADPRRLVLLGQSAGGILAAWIAAHPNRYQAIIPKAFLAADFATGYRRGCRGDAACERQLDYVFGGSPGQVPRAYRANSPLHTISGPGGRVFLISIDPAFRRDNDAFAAALRRKKGVQVEVIRYPGENHTIADPVNQRDVVRRVLLILRQVRG